MHSVNVTARDVRRLNRRVVLQRIYARQPISRLEISQQSGLSSATVTNVVGELLTEQIILETGVEASEGGRPRALLSMNRDYGFFLGCELGETSIVVDLFDILMNKLVSWERDLTEEENTPTTVAYLIERGVTNVLSDAKIQPEQILGMGIGVPGIVEQEQHLIFSSPSWNWQPVPLLPLLRQSVSFPIFLENGAKTMALAEMNSRIEDQSIEHLAVVNIGTGIGGGVIEKGTLYRGATNSAGEIGHTIIQMRGRQCRCGRQGCLETYVGAPGIIQTLREHEPNYPGLESGDQRSLIASLVTAAQQQDPLAMEVLAETTEYLSVGLANFINLFNMQHLILGGWIGMLIGPLILDDLKKQVSKLALQLPFEAVNMSLSQLGSDAASYGAAHVAVEYFLTNVGRMGRATPSTEALLRSKR
jgi:predicted NBD/HSP70 family sugar kinase